MTESWPSARWSGKTDSAWRRVRSEPDVVTPGRQIRAARLAAGLTQRQLADALGTNRRVVALWERDGTMPDTGHRAGLCRALGVPAAVLFEGRVRDQAPEQNTAVVAARFARALAAEASAVTSADVAARSAPPDAVRPSSGGVAVGVERRPQPAWRQAANCLGIDPELFYPQRGGSKVLQAEQIRAAKAVCASCTVRAQCLFDAIERNEEWGIWGGLSERERRDWLTRLPRIARCSRCGERYRKTASGQKFCGDRCPALARTRPRTVAS